MSEVLLGKCEEVNVVTPLLGVCDVGDQHTALQVIDIADLSVGVTDDTQVVLSDGWHRTADGTYVTNSPENRIIVHVRNSSTVRVLFRGSLFSSVASNGEPLRPRLGMVGQRQFTSFASKGALLPVRPVLHAADVGACGFNGLDGTATHFEWQPVGPPDAEGGSTALESMVLPEDYPSGEFGMFWELAGFVVSANAEFLPVEITLQSLAEDHYGDSNCGGGYLQPQTGSVEMRLKQVRSGVLGLGVTTETYDERCSIDQWPRLLMDEYCSTRRLDRDVVAFLHGGAWQGVMGPAKRASIVANIWPNPYLDTIDRLCSTFHAGPPYTSGSHWAGGTRRARLIFVGSGKNDWIQRAFEISAGVENYFGGTTYRDGIKALLDALIALNPANETAILAHTSAEVDTGAIDTYARFKEACVSGGATGRSFQDGATAGAEGSVGLYLSLARDAAAAGLPTAVIGNPLHWTSTQHTALKEAVKALVFSWLDTALGLVFVDSAAGSGGSGTYAAPYNTLAAAGSSWKMLAIKGTFNEKLTLAASGSSTLSRIVYAWGATAVIDGGSGARDCIDTGGQSNVRIFGVELRNGILGAKVSSGTGVVFYRASVHGCTSHGFGISGGAVSVQQCQSYSNAGSGLSASGSATVTSVRNRIYSNSGLGIVWAGSATVVDSFSHIYENSQHGVGSAASASGSGTFRNSKIGLRDITSGTVGVDLWAAAYVESGTLVLQNCSLHSGNSNGAITSYCIRATSTGIVTYENCVLNCADVAFATYVWVTAVGASGNIQRARNNAYQERTSGSGFKFAVGPTLVGSTIHTFATWSALLARDATLLEVNGGFGDIGQPDSTPASEPLDDRPSSATTSIARGLGVNLTSTFTTDFHRRTRPSTGAWDSGVFILD